MFGVSRKKSKPTNVRATASAESSDDDDDAHRSSRIQQKQHERRKKSKGSTGEKKKKKRSSSAATPMLSFDPEEGGGGHDDDDAFLPMKSKKRKKHSKKKSGRGGGLGYGGLGAMAMDVASDGSSSEMEKKHGDDGEVDERDGGSYYDAAALEKLRLEQKRSTLVKQTSLSLINLQPKK